MQTIDRNVLRPAAKFVAPHTADSWAFQCVKVLDDGRAVMTDGYRATILREGEVDAPPGTWDFYRATEVSNEVKFPAAAVMTVVREAEARSPVFSAGADSARMRRRIRAMVREARDGRRRARRMVVDSGATLKARQKELEKLPKVSDPIRGILAPFSLTKLGVFAADETGWQDPAVGIDLAFLDDALSLAPRGKVWVEIRGELEPVRVQGPKGECWVMPCKR